MYIYIYNSLCFGAPRDLSYEVRAHALALCLSPSIRREQTQRTSQHTPSQPWFCPRIHGHPESGDDTQFNDSGCPLDQTRHHRRLRSYGGGCAARGLTDAAEVAEDAAGLADAHPADGEDGRRADDADGTTAADRSSSDP